MTSVWDRLSTPGPSPRSPNRRHPRSPSMFRSRRKDKKAETKRVSPQSSSSHASLLRTMLSNASSPSQTGSPARGHRAGRSQVRTSRTRPLSVTSPRQLATRTVPKSALPRMPAAKRPHKRSVSLPRQLSGASGGGVGGARDGMHSSLRRGYEQGLQRARVRAPKRRPRRSNRNASDSAESRDGGSLASPKQTTGVHSPSSTASATATPASTRSRATTAVSTSPRHSAILSNSGDGKRQRSAWTTPDTTVGSGQGKGANKSGSSPAQETPRGNDSVQWSPALHAQASRLTRDASRGSQEVRRRTPARTAASSGRVLSPGSHTPRSSAPSHSLVGGVTSRSSAGSVGAGGSVRHAAVARSSDHVISSPVRPSMLTSPVRSGSTGTSSRKEPSAISRHTMASGGWVRARPHPHSPRHAINTRHRTPTGDASVAASQKTSGSTGTASRDHGASPSTRHASNPQQPAHIRKTAEPRPVSTSRQRTQDLRATNRSRLVGGMGSGIHHPRPTDTSTGVSGGQLGNRHASSGVPVRQNAPVTYTRNSPSRTTDTATPDHSDEFYRPRQRAAQSPFLLRSQTLGSSSAAALQQRLYQRHSSSSQRRPSHWNSDPREDSPSDSDGPSRATLTAHEEAAHEFHRTPRPSLSEDEMKLYFNAHTPSVPVSSEPSTSGQARRGLRPVNIFARYRNSLPPGAALPIQEEEQSEDERRLAGAPTPHSGDTVNQASVASGSQPPRRSPIPPSAQPSLSARSGMVQGGRMPDVPSSPTSQDAFQRMLMADTGGRVGRIERLRRRRLERKHGGGAMRAVSLDERLTVPHHRPNDPSASYLRARFRGAGYPRSEQDGIWDDDVPSSESSHAGSVSPLGSPGGRVGSLLRDSDSSDGMGSSELVAGGVGGSDGSGAGVQTGQFSRWIHYIQEMTSQAPVPSTDYILSLNPSQRRGIALSIIGLIEKVRSLARLMSVELMRLVSRQMSISQGGEEERKADIRELFQTVRSEVQESGNSEQSGSSGPRGLSSSQRREEAFRRLRERWSARLVLLVQLRNEIQTGCRVLEGLRVYERQLGQALQTMAQADGLLLEGFNLPSDSQTGDSGSTPSPSSPRSATGDERDRAPLPQQPAVVLLGGGGGGGVGGSPLLSLMFNQVIAGQTGGGGAIGSSSGGGGGGGGGTSLLNEDGELRVEVVSQLFHQLQAREDEEKKRKAESRRKAMERVLPHTLTKTMDRDCCICLEGFDVGGKVLTLPCTHHYHPNCIQEWISRKNECPLCKHPPLPEVYN